MNRINYFIIKVLFINQLVYIVNGNLPIVINTWGFIEANREAWRVLNEPGSSTLDALVAGCSKCEELQCDGTVGYGGSPDENAETTLDAMIMDGETMNVGAIANLRQIKSVIKVARHVLENTKHTMLTGDQATEFAVQMGFRKESLTTSKSKKMWSDWRDNNCQPNFWQNVIPDSNKHCGPYSPIKNIDEESNDVNERYDFSEKNHDTIGMIIIDKNGKILAGTSTNGAKHKIPGRVGDSPIPGAGAYADNKFGAAAATGDGDIMMRFLPAFAAVENLKHGMSIKESADDAMQRIKNIHSNFFGGLILIDNTGKYSASCVGMDKFPYSVHNYEQKDVIVKYVDCLKN